MSPRPVRCSRRGPRLRRHVPEFRPDCLISTLNNTYLTGYPGDQTAVRAARATKIMTVDPVSRNTQVGFGDAPGQKMLPIIRGQHELRAGGGMVITEFDAGRVIEVDAGGAVVRDCVNACSDTHIGEVTNAGVYPAACFGGGLPACSG